MSTRSIAVGGRSDAPRHRLEALSRPRGGAFTLRPLIAMGTVIVTLYLLGWGGLVIALVLAPQGRLAAGVGIGIGVTAYVLGVRHAFDADHIAAIDNVTRSLSVPSRRRPTSIGFWFSLGHSTVVIALAAVLVLGLRAVLQVLIARGSWQHELAGMVGGIVPGVFLLAVGAINGVSVVRTLRSRSASALGAPAGPLARLFRRPLRAVGRPVHMYLVGLLFGLGLDTATEVGLLVAASAGAASGVPWYAVLALPVLFTAGMVTFDTLDGAFMAMAYAWSLSDPSRTRRYSVIVTSLSAVLAGAIGLAQLLSALPAGGGWLGIVQDQVNRADPTVAGVAVVVLLSAVFAVAAVTGIRSRVTDARR